MKQSSSHVRVGALAIGISMAACVGDGSSDEAIQALSGNGYIVVVDGEAGLFRGLSIAAEHGAPVGHIYDSAIHGFSFHGSAAAAAALASNPAVLYVERDTAVTLVGKPGRGGSGGSDSAPPAQVTPWGISRVGGGLDGTTLGTAWVIDTGIDSSHPDLNVDSSRCANFASLRGKVSDPCNDGNGHGTHVAGTIAALNNDIGVIGVAAGAPVVAVRVLDDRGSGMMSGVLAGVDYVAANASVGDVANMSLGGSASQALDDAVTAAAATGVKFAVAAGNESMDADNSSPARAAGANIYTVSAIDDSDTFAYFSNYGASVEFAAPGVAIESTWPGGGLNTISGTSMASPHVAGLLLLGPINADGVAQNDPDGNPDPIAHH